MAHLRQVAAVKLVTPTRTRHGFDAWGRPGYWFVTVFQLEDSDVGRVIDNFNGYRCGQSHVVTHRDVGRLMEQFTYGDHDPTHSWHFYTPENPSNE